MALSHGIITWNNNELRVGIDVFLTFDIHFLPILFNLESVYVTYI